MASGEIRRAPFSHLPLAEWIARCSPGARGYNTVLTFGGLRGVVSAEPYGACFLLSVCSSEGSFGLAIPDGEGTGEASVV